MLGIVQILTCDILVIIVIAGLILTNTITKCSLSSIGGTNLPLFETPLCGHKVYYRWLQPQTICSSRIHISQPSIYFLTHFIPTINSHSHLGTFNTLLNACFWTMAEHWTTRENMQAPYGNSQAWDANPQPYSCVASTYFKKSSERRDS